MNKQLIISLFFLCISSKMLFSAEMEAGQNLRKKSRRVQSQDLKYGID
ncbi:hypothetical protein LCGC14_3065880, partial [marine sediment metagenome]